MSWGQVGVTHLGYRRNLVAQVLAGRPIESIDGRGQLLELLQQLLLQVQLHGSATFGPIGIEQRLLPIGPNADIAQGLLCDTGQGLELTGNWPSVWPNTVGGDGRDQHVGHRLQLLLVLVNPQALTRCAKPAGDASSDVGSSGAAREQGHSVCLRRSTSHPGLAGCVHGHVGPTDLPVLDGDLRHKLRKPNWVVSGNPVQAGHGG